MAHLRNTELGSQEPQDPSFKRGRSGSQIGRWWRRRKPPKATWVRSQPAGRKAATAASQRLTHGGVTGTCWHSENEITIRFLFLVHAYEYALERSWRHRSLYDRNYRKCQSRPITLTSK